MPGARSVQDLSGAVRCRSISNIKSRVFDTEFVPRRSLWVTELVKIFGFDKHSVCRWIGHVEHIQDEHYLQMMDDDHVAIMSNLSDRRINPSGAGWYLSEMLFIALNRNLRELVEAPTVHALGITKIGKNKIFDIPAVRATPVWSPPRDIFKSSGGGTQKTGNSLGKYRVAKVKGVKTTTSDNGVSVTPTLLASIWSELGEVEQGKVEQVILDYVEAQQDVEVE